ncbi:hypothetical protein B0187_01250 [Haemophilus paracuniculus]|uniref:Transferrin-binding protein B C-lobe/N-lobe beta barrel domain-containing protein n=1 Tax=Haemophilus paracuniculus TaxID=734 RepID=A0A1T0AV16_9PAST|nr:hypothetical protein [Haemophilus paracuniculus]OOS00561.1 hypothetical protein B0187_01250 [Haemophilus paracuniculus]
MKVYTKASLILVSIFSLASCGSSDKAKDNPSQPQNQPTNKVSPATTNNVANPSNNLPSSVPNNESKPTSSSNSPTTNSGKAPTQKPVSQTGQAVEVTNDGVEWRKRRLTSDNFKPKYPTLKVIGNLANDGNTGYELDGQSYESPLRADNSHIILDFKKLANDGKPYLGTHTGTLEDKLMEGELKNAEGKSIPATKIDYAFGNLPYSTYGILFDGNRAEVFYQGLAAGQNLPDLIEYVVQERNGNADYIDEVRGNATYKGELIASIVEQNKDYSYGKPNKPFVDGTFEIRANFGESKNNPIFDSSLTGEMKSNTVGNIMLYEGEISRIHNAFSGKARAENFSGEYSGIFVGKNLNDIVGRIELENKNKDLKEGEIKEYHAAFGGTKQ